MKDRWFMSLLFNKKSYRITIPKDIVKQNGWKKGERLALINEDGRLFIDGKKKRIDDKLLAFSIGYEGKTIGNFIRILKENGIKQLIDVRENPFSYKEGFSKIKLKTFLNEAEILYAHIPQLGTDKQSRKEYKENRDLTRLFEIYNERFNENKDSYECLKALIHYDSSVIMCFEDNYEYCHRSIIENNLEKDGIGVVHLCNGKQNEFF